MLLHKRLLSIHGMTELTTRPFLKKMLATTTFRHRMRKRQLEYIGHIMRQKEVKNAAITGILRSSQIKEVSGLPTSLMCLCECLTERERQELGKEKYNVASTAIRILKKKQFYSMFNFEGYRFEYFFSSPQTQTCLNILYYLIQAN